MSRKWSYTALAALVALVGMASVAQASSVEREGRYFVSGFGEYLWVDEDKTASPQWKFVEDGYGAGLDVGYYITDNFAVRAEVARQILDSAVTGKDAGGVRYGIDGLYHLFGSGLYAVGGLKNIRWDEGATLANAGLGYRAFLSDRLSLFVEGNYYYDLMDDYGDIGAKVGLSWLFSKPAPVIPAVAEPEPAPVPAPVVVDTDGDGVADELDKCANTPAGDKVDEDGCLILVEKQVSFTLNIPFANDSAVIENQYKSDIKNLGDFMTRYPNTDVEIQGHASAVGSEKYNQKLSEKRATAVANVLVNEYQISASRVSVAGYGFSRPLVQGNTPQAHAANRRIEAQVIAVEKKALQRQQ